MNVAAARATRLFAACGNLARVGRENGRVVAHQEAPNRFSLVKRR